MKILFSPESVESLQLYVVLTALQDKLKIMRDIMDKIVYLLNNNPPTILFENSEFYALLRSRIDTLNGISLTSKKARELRSTKCPHEWTPVERRVIESNRRDTRIVFNRQAALHSRQYLGAHDLSAPILAVGSMVASNNHANYLGRLLKRSYPDLDPGLPLTSAAASKRPNDATSRLIRRLVEGGESSAPGAQFFHSNNFRELRPTFVPSPHHVLYGDAFSVLAYNTMKHGATYSPIRSLDQFDKYSSSLLPNDDPCIVNPDPVSTDFSMTVSLNNGEDETHVDLERMLITVLLGEDGNQHLTNDRLLLLEMTNSLSPAEEAANFLKGDNLTTGVIDIIRSIIKRHFRKDPEEEDMDEGTVLLDDTDLYVDTGHLLSQLREGLDACASITRTLLDDNHHHQSDDFKVLYSHICNLLLAKVMDATHINRNNHHFNDLHTITVDFPHQALNARRMSSSTTTRSGVGRPMNVNSADTAEYLTGVASANNLFEDSLRIKRVTVTLDATRPVGVHIFEDNSQRKPNQLRSAMIGALEIPLGAFSEASTALLEQSTKRAAAVSMERSIALSMESASDALGASISPAEREMVELMSNLNEGTFGVDGSSGDRVISKTKQPLTEVVSELRRGDKLVSELLEDLDVSLDAETAQRMDSIASNQLFNDFPDHAIAEADRRVGEVFEDLPQAEVGELDTIRPESSVEEATGKYNESPSLKKMASSASEGFKKMGNGVTRIVNRFTTITVIGFSAITGGALVKLSLDTMHASRGSHLNVLYTSGSQRVVSYKIPEFSCTDKTVPATGLQTQHPALRQITSYENTFRKELQSEEGKKIESVFENDVSGRLNAHIHCSEADVESAGPCGAWNDFNNDFSVLGMIVRPTILKRGTSLTCDEGLSFARAFVSNTVDLVGTAVGEIATEATKIVGEVAESLIGRVIKSPVLLLALPIVFATITGIKSGSPSAGIFVLVFMFLCLFLLGYLYTHCRPSVDSSQPVEVKNAPNALLGSFKACVLGPANEIGQSLNKPFDSGVPRPDALDGHRHEIVTYPPQLRYNYSLYSGEPTLGIEKQYNTNLVLKLRPSAKGSVHDPQLFIIRSIGESRDNPIRVKALPSDIKNPSSPQVVYDACPADRETVYFFLTSDDDDATYRLHVYNRTANHRFLVVPTAPSMGLNVLLLPDAVHAFTYTGPHNVFFIELKRPRSLLPKETPPDDIKGTKNIFNCFKGNVSLPNSIYGNTPVSLDPVSRSADDMALSLSKLLRIPCIDLSRSDSVELHIQTGVITPTIWDSFIESLTGELETLITDDVKNDLDRLKAESVGNKTKFVHLRDIMSEMIFTLAQSFFWAYPKRYIMGPLFIKTIINNFVIPAYVQNTEGQNLKSFINGFRKDYFFKINAFHALGSLVSVMSSNLQNQVDHGLRPSLHLKQLEA